MNPGYLKLGEILLERDVITKKQLQTALEDQERSLERLGRILVARHYATEEDVASALRAQFGFERASFAAYPIDRDALDLVPETVARTKGLSPLKKANGKLTVAVADPVELLGSSDFELATGCSVEVLVATEAEIAADVAVRYSGAQVSERLADTIGTIERPTRTRARTSEAASNDTLAQIPTPIEEIGAPSPTSTGRAKGTKSAGSDTADHLPPARPTRERAPTRRTEAAPRAGQQIGRYLLGKAWWTEPYAYFFEATDQKLDRPVMLAVVRCGSEEWMDALSVHAQALARASHPNLLDIHDFEEFDGQPVISSEPCTGTKLSDFVKRNGPMEPGAACIFAVHICHALEALHEYVPAYERLNADNVVITTRGSVKLTLLGLQARANCAPEHASGQPVSAATDVYAVGTLVLETVGGADDLPDAIGAIIRRARAADPNARYSSVAELREALSSVQGIEGRETTAAFTSDASLPTATSAKRPAAARTKFDSGTVGNPAEPERRRPNPRHIPEPVTNMDDKIEALLPERADLPMRVAGIAGNSGQAGIGMRWVVLVLALVAVGMVAAYSLGAFG